MFWGLSILFHYKAIGHFQLQMILWFAMFYWETFEENRLPHHLAEFGQLCFLGALEKIPWKQLFLSVTLMDFC